jgi:hypothetical protein
METHHSPLSHQPLSFPPLFRAIAVVTASLVAATAVSAQAWMPPGERKPRSHVCSSDATHHIFSREITVVETGETGKSVSYGEEYSNVAVLSVDFGLTDKLGQSGRRVRVLAVRGLPAAGGRA